jgi:hypothetical protein
VVNEPDTPSRPPCTTAIGPEGALLGAIDLVRIDKARKVRQHLLGCSRTILAT